MKTLVLKMYNGKGWITRKKSLNIESLDDVGPGCIAWLEGKFKATAYKWWIED